MGAPSRLPLYLSQIPDATAPVVHDVSGTTAATSTTTGTPTASEAVQGTTAATSTTSGTPTLSSGAQGTTAAMSTTTGTTALRAATEGTTAAVSSTEGEPTTQAGTSGTSDAMSTAYGEPLLVTTAAGSSEATSSTFGAPEMVAALAQPIEGAQVAATTHTLTYDFGDLTGADLDPKHAVAWVETNLDPGQAVVDTNTGGQVMLGSKRLDLDTTAAGTIDLVTTAGATIPTNFQYRVWCEYRTIFGGAVKKERWNSGWFSWTAAANLKDVVEETYAPPTYLTQLTAQLDAHEADLEDDLTTHAGGLESALTAAALGDEDALLAAAVTGPSTATRTALNTAIDRLVGYNAASYGAVGDGATDNAAAFAALAADVNADTSPGTVSVYLPPAGGHYMYSGGLDDFTRPARLYGAGASSTLNYTGTGKAVKLGPDGLLIGTAHQDTYSVEKIRFAGGASMTHGIYFNRFVVSPLLKDVEWDHFGNAGAFGVWYAGNNWHAALEGGRWYATGSVLRHWLRVFPDGINSTQLTVTGVKASNQSNNGYRGVGLWFDGAGSFVGGGGTKIEGFAPNIRVGRFADHLTIDGVYFETTDNGGCIQFGGVDSEPGAGDYTTNLTVQNVFANMHNTDSIATTSYFLEPTTTSSGLQGTLIENVLAGSSNRELVKQNALSSQVENRAENVSGYVGSVNTAGAAWKLDHREADSETGRLLTTTGYETVVDLPAPQASSIYLVSYFYKVANASTDVDLAVWYSNGGGKTAVVQPVTAKAVGQYAVQSVLIATDGSDAITVVARAGIANNVTVSGYVQRVA